MPRSNIIRLLLIAVFAVWCSTSALAQDEELVPIAYVQSSVLSTDGDMFKLLDGSRWIKIGYSMILPASDVTIILTNEEGDGIAFVDGVKIEVELISGTPTLNTGFLGQVVREHGDGAILKLSDGSLWEIPQYDQYDTGYWLPPYWVIVSSDELYLINVEKGKKVWASRIR